MAIDDVRDRLEQLINDYVPEQPGQIVAGSQGFDHIAKDYGGSGTTCGFLPHWLLWRLGCTDNIKVKGNDRKLVNRNEPDSEYQYFDGDNLVHFSQSAAFTPITLQQMKDGSLPKKGDIVLVTSDAKQPPSAKMPGTDATAEEKQAWENWVHWNNKAHVFVFLGTGGDSTSWKYAESGYPVKTYDAKGKKDVTRESAVRNAPGALRKVKLEGSHPTCDIAGDYRRITGWLSLDKLSFAGNPPVAAASDVLKMYTLRPSLPQAAQVIGKWRVRFFHLVRGHLEFDYEYHLHKGSRAFYTMADRSVPFQVKGNNHPQQFLGSGFWVNDNGLHVLWPDSSCDEEFTVTIAAKGKLKATAMTPGYRIEAEKL
jgi:hypothetical protein